MSIKSSSLVGFFYIQHNYILFLYQSRLHINIRTIQTYIEAEKPRLFFIRHTLCLSVFLSLFLSFLRLSGEKSSEVFSHSQRAIFYISSNIPGLELLFIYLQYIQRERWTILPISTQANIHYNRNHKLIDQLYRYDSNWSWQSINISTQQHKFKDIHAYILKLRAQTAK